MPPHFSDASAAYGGKSIDSGSVHMIEFDKSTTQYRE